MPSIARGSAPHDVSYHREEGWHERKGIADMDVEIDGIHPEESMQVMSLDVQGVVGVA